jgi:hypothetical protein
MRGVHIVGTYEKPIAKALATRMNHVARIERMPIKYTAKPIKTVIHTREVVWGIIAEPMK